jgi:chromosome segregation ATPase
MTTSRYFMARLVQAFGVVRRNQRMSDAASEVHLLREAEAYLGHAVWEKVEKIERLSVEYWNLRKLDKERKQVLERLADQEARLEAAHQERANLLAITPMVNPEINELRVAILTELEEKSLQRDAVVAKARQVRRTYDGLKMKLEVISKDFDDSDELKLEIEQVKNRLLALKQEFVSLREERLRIGEEIDAGDVRLDLIERDLEVHRKERRESASATFQVIGEINKELAVLRAEDGVLDTRMRQLYADIGRYVSRNVHQDSHCMQAARSHRALVEVMRALRRSIALNHRLAGMS